LLQYQEPNSQYKVNSVNMINILTIPSTKKMINILTIQLTSCEKMFSQTLMLNVWKFFFYKKIEKVSTTISWFL